MKTLIIGIVIALAAAAPPTAAQKTPLQSELEAVHSEWFKAFDRGDGAAMDKLEASNVVLVFEDGVIWKKPSSRVGKVKPTGSGSRSLSDVAIRQFGDTAVLTGLHTTLANKEMKGSIAATTVVFVRQNGKWIVASAQWSPTR